MRIVITSLHSHGFRLQNTFLFDIVTKVPDKCGLRYFRQIYYFSQILYLEPDNEISLVIQLGRSYFIALISRTYVPKRIPGILCREGR